MDVYIKQLIDVLLSYYLLSLTCYSMVIINLLLKVSFYSNINEYGYEDGLMSLLFIHSQCL